MPGLFDSVLVSPIVCCSDFVCVLTAPAGSLVLYSDGNIQSSSVGSHAPDVLDCFALLSAALHVLQRVFCFQGKSGGD